MDQHVVVIGGGAAGFFCAVNAARLHPHLKITILEKTGKLLSKVRISGGGRCNVTHALFDVVELSKRYPRGHHFVKKTFHQFSASDTVEWFRERGVDLKAEADGRMFPESDSSATIVNCLLREADQYNVGIRMNADVRSIAKEEAGFTLQLASGEKISASQLVIATGGYPKYGMFQWLEATGHTINHPVPSLFTFNLPGHPITALMGVSVEAARVRIEGSKLFEEGPVLITHWGLSGPAVIRMSAWGARELAEGGYQFKAHINWMPEWNDQTLKEVMRQWRSEWPGKKIVSHSFEGVPKRLQEFLLQVSGVTESMRFGDLPAKVENALIRNLVDYTVEVKGKTTYKDEFVTAGGIHLSEVDPNTMMSRKLPQLYFAGEVLDVDGITGGFNFQHAWTSGFIAAKALAT